MKKLIVDRQNTHKSDNIPAENDRRYAVTHIRPGDSDEVVKDLITAPGKAAARIRAAMIFPGSRILAVETLPEPLPVRAARDGKASPRLGARFIRGIFRPALFTDDAEAELVPEYISK